MMMQIVFSRPFWNNFTAGDCLINLDQSPTCCLLVTGKERDRQLMVQCESAVTILTKWTQWSPGRQNLFFDEPSNWFTNLRCFQQSHIYRYVFRFFYPPPKKKRKEKNLFGFVLAFCVQLPALILKCGLVSVWKHFGSCGKRCVWGNVDHAPEITQDSSNIMVVFKKNFFGCSLRKYFFFFYSCKKSPFLSLSYFVTNQVFRCREACLSLPPSCLQPVFNSLLCCWFSHHDYCFHALLKNLVFTCILQVIWNKGFIPSFLLVSVNLLSNCLILNSFLVVLQKPKAVCTLR